MKKGTPMKIKIHRLWAVLLIGLTGVLHASNSTAVTSCQKLANIFLATPTKSTLSNLKMANEDECWQAIGGSNAKLEKLLHSVKKGNFSAASYLAANLKALGGGNLEDSLVALGKFSDVDMESFLVLAKQGLLSEHQLGDALTMLPLSTSDNQKAQLSAMQFREQKVRHETLDDLSEEKALALKAIDDFIAEIKASKSGN